MYKSRYKKADHGYFKFKWLAYLRVFGQIALDFDWFCTKGAAVVWATVASEIKIKAFMFKLVSNYRIRKSITSTSVQHLF